MVHAARVRCSQLLALFLVGFVVMDVADDKSVKTATAELLDKYKRVDILVSNAGLSLVG